MNLRDANIERLDGRRFDVLIIGGGINGAVSAAALATRGVKVGLIDRGDFAGFTSQSSSNLAWGGIKYLETYEFGLVRKLCMSRNQLLRAYPSVVKEIRFFTRIEKGFRHPPVLLYLGALLYWVMGNFFTRAPRLLSLKKMRDEEPRLEVDSAAGGMEYSDAYLHDNDARFVFSFVRSAMTYGCIAANYVESLGATREGDLWRVRARDVTDGREFDIEADTLINACGPYVDAHNAKTGQTTGHRHVFSKGIHLVVDQISRVRRVLTFFADDGRPFFAIPMGNRTVIGTTDTRVGQPETEVTDADRDFVLENINKRLKLDRPLTQADVIAERCGVRPLVVETGADAGEGDWTKLSRKHAIDVDAAGRHLSIYGGKLTDCINVGEEVCGAVASLGVPIPFPKRRWFGEPGEELREEFMYQAELLGLDALTSPDSSEPLSQRLWRRYGARAIGMLEDIRRDPTMAEVLIETSEYIRCEIYRLKRHEMVVKLEDFLRRRSKIALVVRHDRMLASQGLKDACFILFGGRAKEKWEEYFGQPWVD